MSWRAGVRPAGRGARTAPGRSRHRMVPTGARARLRPSPIRRDDPAELIGPAPAGRARPGGSADRERLRRGDDVAEVHDHAARLGAAERQRQLVAVELPADQGRPVAVHERVLVRHPLHRAGLGAGAARDQRDELVVLQVDPVADAPERVRVVGGAFAVDVVAQVRGQPDVDRAGLGCRLPAARREEQHDGEHRGGEDHRRAGHEQQRTVRPCGGHPPWVPGVAWPGPVGPA